MKKKNKIPPLFKLLGKGGRCINNGIGRWSLPKNGKPGEWWIIEGRIEPCLNGLHLVSADMIPHWISPSVKAIYRVEYEGRIIKHASIFREAKYVAEKARLVSEVKLTITDVRELRKQMLAWTAKYPIKFDYTHKTLKSMKINGKKNTLFMVADISRLAFRFGYKERVGKELDKILRRKK